ncbi:hypothetical protein [Flavobacterium sp. UMI-01]|uniref:hypothetical protein n=1 Tax=Flavobacterium sp. UMI-01 TaxID=1441053 RepID=UPI001C7DF538|nr:hypothetical protein [Flavobacterium sp. UMI-01]GIZ10020.1 hypothetical protein FUMI01_27460 [Flavobacterium sp. UMI-01]
MKKFILLAFAFHSFLLSAQEYEYKLVTCVESIVPSGLGRSRMIDVQDKRNFKDFTSGHNEGRNKSDRSDIRVENFEETKLLNFYNLGGIRFENIAANDALISSKINTLATEGWEFMQVVSGVESDAGTNDGQGIYITRIIFKRKKQ